MDDNVTLILSEYAKLSGVALLGCAAMSKYSDFSLSRQKMKSDMRRVI